VGGNIKAGVDGGGISVVGVGVAIKVTATVTGAGATIGSGSDVSAATVALWIGKVENIRQTANTTLERAEMRQPVICRRWSANTRSRTAHHCGRGAGTSAAAASVAAISPCNQS
jgi:hypothetical protein